MGLFMGMSVLSAIEVIIYVSKVTWILISKGRRNYLASKKQKEIEREQRLTETLEIAKKRRDMASEEVGTDDNEIDEPPGFSSRLRRFAGGIRRRSASVWSQHYASEPPSYPEVEQGDCKPSTGLPDVGSFLAPPSRVSTKSRNFVDSVIEARLHGQGRAIQRDLEGEQSDDDALVELQINLNDLLSGASSKPGDNPTIAVVRPRTNSDPSQPQATLSPQAADTRHSTKSGKHRSATIVSGDFDHDHASVHPTPVMNEKNPSSMKVPGFLVRNLSPMLGAAAHLATEAEDSQSATKQPARRNPSSKN